MTLKPQELTMANSPQLDKLKEREEKGWVELRKEQLEAGL